MFKVGQRLRQIDNLIEGERPEVTVVAIEGNYIHHLHDSDLSHSYTAREEDFVPFEESPTEFKVGDKVKVKKCIEEPNGHNGKIGVIETIEKINKVRISSWAIRPWRVILEDGEICWPSEIELIERGDSMSKYEEIMQKIGSMNEKTTIKELDDILQEIYQNSNKGVTKFISIPISSSENAKIYIEDVNHSGYKAEAFFRSSITDSQCKKLDALKETLGWLLEESNIRKDDKQDKIDALQKQVDELSVKIKELKGGV